MRGRLNAVPTLLNDMPLERAGQIFLHPIHQEAFPALVQFIVDLRNCRTYPDYYRFQQELLDKVLEVQGHRAACRKVARRLRAGRTIPSDAPELRSGENVKDPEYGISKPTSASALTGSSVPSLTPWPGASSTTTGA